MHWISDCMHDIYSPRYGASGSREHTPNLELSVDSPVLPGPRLAYQVPSSHLQSTSHVPPLASIVQYRIIELATEPLCQLKYTQLGVQ